MADKLIQLFIMEYKKNLKRVDLLNWSGMVFIGDRKHIDIIQDIPEIANSAGIYFLMGNNESSEDKYLYIGEADDVATRIKQHSTNKSKDWFEEFLIFVSKDSYLNKAHAKYLEKSFYDMAKQNLTTITLKNGNCPSGANLSDYDISYVNEFQNNIIFILNNLGIINFVQTQQKNKVEKVKKDIFYLPLTQNRVDKNGEIVKARLEISDNGYLLLKGSYVESEERAPSFKKHVYYKIRKKLEDDNLFVTSDIEGLYMTKEDIPFKACSAAAAVCKNRATNGRTEWKLSDGTTLDEFERKE